MVSACLFKLVGKELALRELTNSVSHVQEGFIDYLATLLKRARRKRASDRRRHPDQQDHPDSRWWSGMAVVGIGLGAAVAFGVRQALS